MSHSGNPKLTALMVSHPVEAFETIKAALNGRTVIEAADELGVTRRTLHRWLEDNPKLARACKPKQGQGRKKVR